MRHYIYILLLIVTAFNTNVSYSQWGDCSNSIEACTNPSFYIEPSGSGNDVDFTTGSNISNPSTNPNAIPGNGGCMLSGELNSTWLLVTISSTGTLEFTLGDGIGTNYYDWIMWPYDASTCAGISGNTLPPVACNYNAFGISNSLTGMAPASNLPPGGIPENFETPINVNAGDQYIICFSNYDGAFTSVPLDFPGTAGITCGSTIDATICEGDTAIISASDGVSFAWETSTFGFITTNAAGDTAFVNPTITTSYPVVITFFDGTSVSDTAAVTVYPGINASTTVIEDLCFGDGTASISVSTPGGEAPYSFALVGPISGTNTNGTFSNLPTGTYTIDITDNLGCTDLIAVIINPGPPCCDMTISTTGGSVNCAADCSGLVVVDTVNSTPPLVIQWYDENNDLIIGAFNDSLSSLCSGDYYVEVTDALCTLRDTATIDIDLLLPNVTSSNDTTITVDQDITLWSSGGSYYNWSPDTFLDCSNCDTVISSPGEDITYFIQVTDSFGCAVEDTIVVTVLYSTLFIPTGFSPNGDNENDVLYIRGGGIASLQLQIFDKWGSLVFETIDSQIGWDGTFNGKPLNTGVFVYRMDVQLKNGQNVNQSGNITLFR